MADLRPLGSEKLQGMNKIDRILQLSYYMDAPIVESDNNKTLNYSVVLSALTSILFWTRRVFVE